LNTSTGLIEPIYSGYEHVAKIITAGSNTYFMIGYDTIMLWTNSPSKSIEMVTGYSTHNKFFSNAIVASNGLLYMFGYNFPYYENPFTGTQNSYGMLYIDENGYVMQTNCNNSMYFRDAVNTLDGNTYFVANDGIYKLTDNPGILEKMSIWDYNYDPLAIGISKNGTIYVSNINHIHRIHEVVSNDTYVRKYSEWEKFPDIVDNSKKLGGIKAEGYVTDIIPKVSNISLMGAYTNDSQRIIRSLFSIKDKLFFGVDVQNNPSDPDDIINIIRYSSINNTDASLTSIYEVGETYTKVIEGPDGNIYACGGFIENSMSVNTNVNAYGVMVFRKNGNNYEDGELVIPKIDPIIGNSCYYVYITTIGELMFFNQMYSSMYDNPNICVYNTTTRTYDTYNLEHAHIIENGTGTPDSAYDTSY
jgi:hypothetical protein